MRDAAPGICEESALSKSDAETLASENYEVHLSLLFICS